MPISNHILDSADFFPSPHFDDRADTQDISLLVLHNISLPPGQYDNNYIRDFFMGNLTATEHPYFEQIKAMRVSAHLLIKRCGKILQFVPFDKRAWHAGVSVFQGRDKCNDYSIGIEIEGCDDEHYTDAQYEALVTVSHSILSHYPKINLSRIVGHNDIAPGRKTDPGPSFDWAKYRGLLSTMVMQSCNIATPF